MPYTADTAPEWVKKLGPAKAKTWAGVWNSAYERAASMTPEDIKTKLKQYDPKKSKKKNAESYAFATAASVLAPKSEDEIEALWKQALLEGWMAELVAIALMASRIDEDLASDQTRPVRSIVALHGSTSETPPEEVHAALSASVRSFGGARPHLSQIKGGALHTSQIRGITQKAALRREHQTRSRFHGVIAGALTAGGQ